MLKNSPYRNFTSVVFGPLKTYETSKKSMLSAKETF